ncbi:unnamed protein product [Closterium sp. Yama58-4]|nr:unnamed protein product [Closterium sp. Yama58-4]
MEEAYTRVCGPVWYLSSPNPTPPQLPFLSHQASREEELAVIMREMEEAKAQFHLMKANAESELALARQAVLERDVKLEAAQQAMGALVKVVVEYWGEGHEVLLAGSFNGWQSHVPLVPDESSHIPNHDGSRGAMIWSCTLWLYPGHYQVKFIVDGRWTLDQRRAVVEGNMGQNNLLIVNWEDEGLSSDGGSHMASNTFPPTFLR